MAWNDSGAPPRRSSETPTEVVALVVGSLVSLVVGIMIYAGVLASRSALYRDQELLGKRVQ